MEVRKMLMRSYIHANPTISKILNDPMFFPHRNKIYEIARENNFPELANMLEGKETTFGQDVTNSTENARRFFEKAPTEFVEIAYNYAVQHHATLLALTLQDTMRALGNLSKIEKVLHELENSEDPVKMDFEIQLRISLYGKEGDGPYEFDIYTAANYRRNLKNLRLET